MRWNRASVGAWALSIFLGGCGGGGGTDAAASPTTPSPGAAPTTPPPGGAPTRPDIVLLMVSGHDWSVGGASTSYLQGGAGPEIENDLTASGLSVATVYYVDDAFPVGNYGGFYELVADMEYVRDSWAPLGSRVILVSHSHGGVWAHAAVRAVPGLTITCQVDLDCSSYGWGTVGHVSQNAAMGGDPRSVYNIGFVVTPAAYPGVPSEQTGIYDIEDTVFSNVVSNLDVRSGAAPLGGEWYDEVWNLRLDATTTGLYYYFSASSHAEVHAAGGATLANVRSWLHARLGR